MTSSHKQHAPADRLAAIRVARAILGGDAEAAHAAALGPGTCPACVTIAAGQLGLVLLAQMTGRAGIDGELHRRLLAALDEGEGELRGVSN
jgi:hypothetical protein